MAAAGVDDDDYENDNDSVLAVESDVDSNFGDSPVDGYFSERQHPRDTFVENPSIPAGANGKANEVSQEQSSSSRAAPSSRTSGSVPWSANEAPNVNQEAPPPDYASAMASRSPSESALGGSASHSPAEMGYGSIQSPTSGSQSSNIYSDNPRPSSHRGSLDSYTSPNGPLRATTVPAFGTRLGPDAHGTAPQSMSDAPPSQHTSADEETGLLRPDRRRKSRWLWRCKSVSSCSVLIVGIVILLLTILLSTTDHTNTTPRTPGGTADNDGATPTTTPSFPTPTIPASTKCQKYWSSDTVAVRFDSADRFLLSEFIEAEHIQGRVFGSIRLGAAQEGQTSDIMVYMTVATTQPLKSDGLVYTTNRDTLDITNIDLQGAPSGSWDRSCVWVDIQIAVRPGVKLQHLNLAAAHLDVVIEDNLFDQGQGDDEEPILEVSDSSSLYAVHGSVHAAYFSSRETVVEVISGGIQGNFALRDLLSLKSHSGGIQVSVDPKEADPDRPAPAEFVAVSRSGSLQVEFPVEGMIPEREYRTRVEGYSGSIKGTYVLGATTTISGKSGSIDTTLLPYFDPKLGSVLVMGTISGSTHLQVLPPYGHLGEIWGETESSHKISAQSGSVDVTYPGDWEGSIDCTSISGSVRVSGKDVRVTKDERLGPMRKLSAVKGDGKGKIGVSSTSGSIKVRVGNQF